MADQEQLDDFLEALETAGSPAPNAQLREALGWPEDQYEAVKAELVARKIVVRGRGRSDTVSLVGAEPVAKAAAPATAAGGTGRKSKPAGGGSANLGFEAKLWLTADKLRNNMDAAEYKHVVLGLIFLKYISDSFEEQRSKLLAGEGDYEGANPEDPDEYKAENVFWVPAEARWSHRSVDLLGRVYEYFLTRFALAEGKNGGQFFIRPAVWCAAWWRCWSPTRAASTTPAAAPAACSCRARSSWKATVASWATFRSTARKATPPRAAWRCSRRGGMWGRRR